MNTFMFKLGALVKQSWPFGDRARYGRMADQAGARVREAEQAFKQDFPGRNAATEVTAFKAQDPGGYAKQQGKNLAANTGGVMSRGPGGAVAYKGETPAAKPTTIPNAPGQAGGAQLASKPPQRIPAFTGKGQTQPRPPPLQAGQGRMIGANGQEYAMSRGTGRPASGMGATAGQMIAGLPNIPGRPSLQPGQLRSATTTYNPGGKGGPQIRTGGPQVTQAPASAGGVAGNFAMKPMAGGGVGGGARPPAPRSPAPTPAPSLAASPIKAPSLSLGGGGMRGLGSSLARK